MLKLIRLSSVLFAVLLAGWAFVGTTTEAKAHTTYVYHTVHKVSNVWHYRNVWHTRYVHRLHRIVHVTLIRPIIHVHLVKRIHIHTVAVVRHVNVWETRVLPAHKTYTSKTIRIWD